MESHYSSNIFKDPLKQSKKRKTFLYQKKNGYLTLLLENNSIYLHRYISKGSSPQSLNGKPEGLTSEKHKSLFNTIKFNKYEKENPIQSRLSRYVAVVWQIPTP
jgi:hypothetical protein